MIWITVLVAKRWQNATNAADWMCILIYLKNKGGWPGRLHMCERCCIYIHIYFISEVYFGTNEAFWIYTCISCNYYLLKWAREWNKQKRTNKWEGKSTQKHQPLSKVYAIKYVSNGNSRKRMHYVQQLFDQERLISKYNKIVSFSNGKMRGGGGAWMC